MKNLVYCLCGLLAFSGLNLSVPGRLAPAAAQTVLAQIPQADIDRFANDMVQYGKAYAERRNFPLAPTVEVRLRSSIVGRLQKPGSGDLDGNAARRRTENLIDRMIVLGVQQGLARNAPLTEQIFAQALIELCPLWPFC